MPFTLNGECRIYWRQDGRKDGPALLLIGPLGSDMSLWDRMVPALAERYCVLRMDLRGQGASDAGHASDRVSTLAQDMIAVLDAAGRTSAYLCGLSSGGIIAMATAIVAQERVDALVLACTSRAMHAPSPFALFTPGFAATHSEIAKPVADDLTRANVAVLSGAVPPEGIDTPTLVIGGARDAVTPFGEHGALLAAAIPHATTRLIDSGHIACLEAPSALAGEIIAFLADLEDGGRQRVARDTLNEAGSTTRRRILGDAYVERSLANMTDFNADFVAMAIRSNWGDVWSRPGLDQRVRRLIVLTITATRGCWDEFRLHVRLGLEQRILTTDELKELLLQISVYAGIPIANKGFAEAAMIIAELDEAAKKDRTTKA